VVRETPIPTPHADERFVPTTLKPYEEVHNWRVITSTRNAFEAGKRKSAAPEVDEPEPEVARMIDAPVPWRAPVARMI
jgi:hypothetical protein